MNSDKAWLAHCQLFESEAGPSYRIDMLTSLCELVSFVIVEQAGIRRCPRDDL